jgi:FKBP-type peptidyl-prolyl cis-trans isomerase
MSIKVYLNIALLVGLVSCCAPKETTQEQQPPMTQHEVQEALIERNRAFLKQERENINAYVDSSESTFIQTGSGLYYSVLAKGDETISITEGDLVEYEYEISTLSGKFLKSSKESGNKKFKLLKDDELVGIHEGVGLMHPQDDYLFIMPAHLAYGITNENGAPLNATLLYKVKIVSVN